jgi:hypothetical protein
MISIFVFLFATLSGYEPTTDRRTSEPHITGDTFRGLADHVYDEQVHRVVCKSVKRGDIIFVKTELLEEFFAHYHPRIRNPYILITHNSDAPTPGPFRHYLDDPKIIAWFGQNVKGRVHPKLTPIPIGFENRCWLNGDPAVLQEERERCQGAKKEHLLYMNFAIRTRPDVRGPLAEQFQSAPFCRVGENRPYREFLGDIGRAKFVLCPRGNGLDTHRAWEALYMGSIPIVKTSAMDRVFDRLPVLIVNDWQEVTQNYLEEKWKEMEGRTYAFEKLFFDYWKELILSAKEER